MADTHWFDRLNKTLVQRKPRRHVVQTFGMLAAGLIGGDLSSDEAAAEQTKGQRSPGAAGKREKTCSKGACRKQWPRSKEDRRSCEATCERCKRTKTKLCMLEGDPNDPAKIADCCEQGQTCCNNDCVDLKYSRFHCGKCNRACKDDEICKNHRCTPHDVGGSCWSGMHLCGTTCRTCCSEQHCRSNTGIVGMECVNQERCVCPSGTKLCQARNRCISDTESLRECCTDADCPGPRSGCQDCTVCREDATGTGYCQRPS